MDKRKASEAGLLKENNSIAQNRKKISEESDFSGKSMLKRNEMSLVLLGAGVLTLIVFFVFFKPSKDPQLDVLGDGSQLSGQVQALEERLTRIEEALQTFDTAKMTLNAEREAEHPDMATYNARVERVETALAVKFDILTTRVDKMGESLSGMAKDIAGNTRKTKDMATALAAKVLSSSGDASFGTKTSVMSVAKKKETASSKTVAVKTSVAAKQKKPSVAPSSSTRKQTKRVPVYHTIQKGDTLYNISKKYNTTVPQLRKFNKMTTKDPIVIGQKIMVKP